MTTGSGIEELATPSRAFVLGLTGSDGHLDGGALYRLAEAAGFSDTKIRLTVRRLAEAGLVVIEGRGRSSTVQLTETGFATRAPDLAWTSLAYRLDAGRVEWDRHWHLVSFEISEDQRRSRDLLRERLVELQAAPLGGGLYVSTYEIEPWIASAAQRLGVSESVATMRCSSLTVGTATAARDIAQRLWPLGALTVEYQQLAHDWRAVLAKRPPDLDEAVRIVFDASARLEAALRHDPLLQEPIAPANLDAGGARQAFRELLDYLSVHDEIKQANVFSSYLDAIDSAATLSDAEFNRRLYADTASLEG